LSKEIKTKRQQRTTRKEPAGAGLDTDELLSTISFFFFAAAADFSHGFKYFLAQPDKARFVLQPGCGPACSDDVPPDDRAPVGKKSQVAT
jgi:hypothetical protein